jgi:hypothetical protein
VLKARLQQLVVDGCAAARGGELIAGFMHRFQHTRGTCSEAWRAHKVWVNAVP